MLINRDELSRKVLDGELTSLDDLNSVLRAMIKDVVETAMGAEMTGFLGYDRYRTPDSDPGNRRNGYSQKELASKVGPIVIDVPRDRKSEFSPAIVKKVSANFAPSTGPPLSLAFLPPARRGKDVGEQQEASNTSGEAGLLAGAGGHVA